MRLTGRRMRPEAHWALRRQFIMDPLATATGANVEIPPGFLRANDKGTLVQNAGRRRTLARTDSARGRPQRPA